MLKQVLDQRFHDRTLCHPFQRHEGTLKALLDLRSSPYGNSQAHARNEAVQELYEDAVRVATGFCRRLKFMPFHERSEEGVQEWFCTLLRPHAGQRLDPRRPVFPWAYAILFYLILAMARKEMRFAPKFAEHAELEKPTDDPLVSAILSELDQAARELPADFFEAISLRIYQGLSAKEAASKLGISAGAVNIRLCRGIAKLRLRWRGGE